MMAGSLETALAYLLAFGLFAVPYWWVHAIWRRRCVAAARRAAAEMEGRYETGGQFSGGRIYGRKDGRDVVVDFFTGTARERARTTAMTTLQEPRRAPILVRRQLLGGWGGVEALPPGAAKLLARLESFRNDRVEAFSNMVTVRAAGVLHDTPRILEPSGLPHPRIEAERLGASHPNGSELRMRRVEQVVALLRDDHRRHHQDPGPAAADPVGAQVRQPLGGGISAPVRRKFPDENLRSRCSLREVRRDRDEIDRGVSRVEMDEVLEGG
jgi:hypothetical protein